MIISGTISRMGGGGFIPMVAPPAINNIGKHWENKMDIEIYASHMEEENPKAHQLFCFNFYSWAQMVTEHNDVSKEPDMGHLKPFVLEDVTKKLSSWPTVLNSTQSPIEEILAAGLLFAIDGYNEIKFEEFPGLDDSYMDSSWGTIFECQGQVDKYNVDFMITCYCNGKKKKIAVECDGHDFHEKTKQQAQHDKARDRAIVKKGITLLRFTGSEIFKDTRACIDEIESVVNNTLESLLAGEALIRGRDSE